MEKGPFYITIFWLHSNQALNTHSSISDKMGEKHPFPLDLFGVFSPRMTKKKVEQSGAAFSSLRRLNKYWFDKKWEKLVSVAQAPWLWALVCTIFGIFFWSLCSLTVQSKCVNISNLSQKCKKEGTSLKSVVSQMCRNGVPTFLSFEISAIVGSAGRISHSLAPFCYWKVHFSISQH